MLSIILNIVEAAPTATLTEFINGKAFPIENAPTITLNTYEYILYNINTCLFYNKNYINFDFDFTVKMLPGDEIPSAINFDPYQNAKPNAENNITNRIPNNTANM